MDTFPTVDNCLVFFLVFFFALKFVDTNVQQLCKLNERIEPYFDFKKNTENSRYVYYIIYMLTWHCLPQPCRLSSVYRSFNSFFAYIWRVGGVEG